MTKTNTLKKCEYKSFDWASKPVIFESLFREYDLRNPIRPMVKGGKSIPASINEEGFRVLGQAYGTYVQKKLNSKKIVVANDYRHYSKGLSYAFITGVLSTGVDVVDIGTHLTPLLYFAQYHFNLPGGAMITASHNDNGWTGLKLAKGFSKTFEPSDIIEYKNLVYSGDFVKGKGEYEKISGFKEIYLKDMKEKVKPLLGKRKLKIVISGGNSIGGMYLAEFFQDIGFRIKTTYCEPDWDFPNVEPNPENLEFLEKLGRAVKEFNADLGVGCDGDGDRLGIVDENGGKIYADRVGLLISRFLVETLGKESQTIIIDVKSTGAYALDQILKKYNTKIIFSKTGHSYVKAATQKHDALAGFERSGHFFLRGEYGRGYDDAILSAIWTAIILSNSNKPISEMIKLQPGSYQSPTLEPSVKDDREKYIITEKVLKYFNDLKTQNKKFACQKIKELITVNGVRFVLETGAWGLIRASSNQPNLVIVCESFKTKREMYDIMEAIQDHLKNYDLGGYDQKMPPYDGEDEKDKKDRGSIL